MCSQVEKALAEQPAAWATWLEALLDVKLLQGRDTAAARAVCVARMAHVLGQQHLPLLLELEQLCLGTRSTLLEHLKAQTSAGSADNAAAAGSSAGDAAAGDAAEWIKWWKRARIVGEESLGGASDEKDSSQEQKGKRRKHRPTPTEVIVLEEHKSGQTLKEGAKQVAEAWYGAREGATGSSPGEPKTRTTAGKVVTAQVQELVRKGKKVEASNALFGDPAPGKIKVLEVTMAPSFSGPHADKYLAEYTRSGSKGYSSLEEAQAACLKDGTAGGITFEAKGGKYTLRKGVALQPSPSGEISWVKAPRGAALAPAAAATALAQPGDVLWKHYPPQPMPPPTAPPPPAPMERQPAVFDIGLMENSDGIQIEGDDKQTIHRSGNSRKCCAPLTAVLEPGSGTYEFTFKIHDDSSCGSGIGVIAAEGRSTELPSAWPNTGQKGVWWLRRNVGETYSELQEHGSTGKVPLDKDVLMTVDTDEGTLKFKIAGNETKYSCKGFGGVAVRPAVFFYNSSPVKVSCDGLAPLGQGETPLKGTRDQRTPKFTVHSKLSSSLKGSSARVTDSGATFKASSDCMALCEKPIKADTGVHVMEVTLTKAAVSYTGMATEGSRRDDPPGRHGGGIGLSSSGSFWRDGNEKKSADSSCKLNDRDVVRLEYDSGPARTLKWFRNGTLIHEEKSVKPGLHFAVGRWNDSPELRLNPKPKAKPKCTKPSKKKDPPTKSGRPEEGDKVKIIGASDDVCEPYKGQIGQLVEDDHTGRPFKILFDDGKTWWFKDGEVVGLVAGAGSDSGSGGELKVGDRVRVKKSVKSPAHGWGSVSHSSVGTLTSVSGDSCEIDFPEQSGWDGKLSEMIRDGEDQSGGGSGGAAGEPLKEQKVGVRVRRGPGAQALLTPGTSFSRPAYLSPN